MTPDPTPAERGLPELNVSWSDHFARQGDMAMSHNYAAFKAAESWILANMSALSRPLPSDWVAVPRGWKLVPARMELTPENMETLAFMLGGDPDAKEADERWNGGTLWVGETIGDNGEKYYGLNVANVECYEEGSVPIVEFAAAPSAPAEAVQTAPEPLAQGQEFVTVPRELTTSMLEAAEQEEACGNDFPDMWEAAIATYLFDKENGNG